MKMIVDLLDREHVNGQFLVANVSKGVTASGNYLSIELRDASGSISGKKWDASVEDESIFVSGNIVNIIGEANKYKDVLQIKILSGEIVNINEIDTTKFIKAPPIPKEELIERFNYYLNSVSNPDCKAILNYIVNKYKDKLYEFPAGVSIHHEYGSGLLVHVTTMADIASKLAPIYNADYDLLITGVLLHDVGKVVELDGPVIFHYTIEGKLLGHISIMMSEIRMASEKLNIKGEIPILLEHMILSHHGQLEYGSPILPLTKEAFLLSLIDNLDSKMVTLSKGLDVTNEGEFTQKIYPLDGRMFYKAKK